jgi:hypothetical protein
MSSVPPRSVISSFGKAKPAKKSFGSNLHSLTNRHQQSLKSGQQAINKNIGLLGEKKQRIERAIPTTKQPIQKHLKQASGYVGNQINNLKAKVNGKR